MGTIIVSLVIIWLGWGRAHFIRSSVLIQIVTTQCMNVTIWFSCFRDGVECHTDRFHDGGKRELAETYSVFVTTWTVPTNKFSWILVSRYTLSVVRNHLHFSRDLHGHFVCWLFEQILF